MRSRNKKWITFWMFFQVLELAWSEENGSSVEINPNKNEPKNFQNIFSPRMDYEQWKPLGRGDPLKHDPTFDYVPPVLDRVQYWVDPAMRKPDPPSPGESQKTEILLLGVTSKKPANNPLQADSRQDTFDSFIKYVDGPKFNPNRRIANPAFFPNPSSFFPSFFPPNKIKYMENIPFSKGVPSTVLMPPPLVSNIPQTSAVTESTTILTTPTNSSPFITLQASNLVFQSSSSVHTDATRGSTLITFEPPVTTSRTIPNFRDQLVFNTHLTPPESFIRIQFAPHNISNKPLIASDTNQHISYVTPPPLIKIDDDNSVMFKGKVTDDDITNTYVKIGKPEAEVQPTFLNTIIQHPVPMGHNRVVFSVAGKPKEPKLPPLTMQTLQEMQEMHPPPATQTPIFHQTTSALLKLLDKEKSASGVSSLQKSPSIETSSISSPTTEILNKENEEEFTTTVPTTTTTTTTTISNIDPIFKLFKPPVKQMKSPQYLIIQGHSKVKTYGPSKQMHGILIQDTNEITDSDEKYAGRKIAGSKNLQDYTVGLIDEMNLRQGRARNLGNIQTLKHVVQTGLGAIDLTGLEAVDIDRNDKDFKETVLHVGYEVVDDKDITEKYYKGIVEEARKLKV